MKWKKKSETKQKFTCSTIYFLFSWHFVRRQNNLIETTFRNLMFNNLRFTNGLVCLLVLFCQTNEQSKENDWNKEPISAWRQPNKSDTLTSRKKRRRMRVWEWVREKEMEQIIWSRFYKRFWCKQEKDNSTQTLKLPVSVSIVSRLYAQYKKKKPFPLTICIQFSHICKKNMLAI